MPPENHIGVPTNPGGGTISLRLLIDYALQRTLTEMTHLSELLPKRTDMERKMDIYHFATRTRQLFVRLLALVKWAGSASKVDKCTEICNFLEQQSMYFIETANSLHKLAHDTLVQARLPAFALPCAVDVLTTGTYPRLPTCIRDKIVPPSPISAQDAKETRQRLNQVIEYRLVSYELPPEMRKLVIDNGVVKFHVEHEFEVTLTLKGDGPTIPWFLISIEILVADPETGDGRSLVHSLQVDWIHRLVQHRLEVEKSRPLHDLYNVLHHFCQSLQLEVLHSQTQRLIQSRLGDSLRVEDYTLSHRLVVSYWRDRDQNTRKDDKERHGYRLSVHVCEEDEGKPLQISHIPEMSPQECRKVGLAIKSDHLSIERLLMQTIEVRTHSKLKDLAKDLRIHIEGPCELRDMPVALYLNVLSPCMKSEIIRVSVNILRGNFLLAGPVFHELNVVQEVEDSLNGDRRNLERLFDKLRLQMYLQRCEKTAQMISAFCTHTLPIINVAGTHLESLSKYRLYVRLPRHSNFYLIVEVREGKRKKVRFSYHLMEVVPCTVEGHEDDLGEDVGVKSFLKVVQVTSLDGYVIMHGPDCNSYEDTESQELESLSRKRKLYLGVDEGPEVKKPRISAYFVSSLAYVLAFSEERLALLNLSTELEKQGVLHKDIMTDGNSSCMCLDIQTFPDTVRCSPEANEMLSNKLLLCRFRIVSKPQRSWLVEFDFAQSPLQSSHFRESEGTQRICLPLDMSLENLQKTVTELLDEWAAMCQLYVAVDRFAKVYNDVRLGLSSVVTVQSYNYRRLVLSYSPKRTARVTVSWRSEGFHLALSSCCTTATANPHILVLNYLQQDLNSTGCLASLAQVLHETWAPLTSIAKLPTVVTQGVTAQPKQPYLSFTILPQSAKNVRITFRNTFCIDITFLEGRMVDIRDNAFSRFDTSKVVEGFNPIPSFKAFLMLFVDEATTSSHARRRSTTEDDNPPSPVGPDAMEVFMMQHPASIDSPASQPPSSRQRADQFRFHSPMTPPSNPHTPASPGASRMPGVNPSPSAALMGAPSPGNLLTGGSPGNPQLHVPSPGFNPAPSPSSMGIHMPSPAGPFLSSSLGDSGSPFPGSNITMPSPGNRQWPASPSMPGPSPASLHGTAMSPGGHPALHSPQTQPGGEHARQSVLSPPSRVLPTRAWAAANPTRLSHDALDTLLTPSTLPSTLPSTQFLAAAPLHRFLGCIYFRRHLSRVIQTDENGRNVRSQATVDGKCQGAGVLSQNTHTEHVRYDEFRHPIKLTAMPCSEPGAFMFKTEHLQFKVFMNPSTLQTLHMKVSQSDTTSKDTWASEEMAILEKFFDLKVACPPYKLNALTAFTRILSAPPRIVKDCIQIMRLELMPDGKLKWSVQWCLTIPPGGHPIAPAGTPAVFIKQKMILMIQLTRIGLNVPQGPENQSIFVPLLYDIGLNTLQIAEPRRENPNTPAHSPSHAAVAAMLRRFSELHQNPQECALFPAVRELMTNLVLPVS